LVRPPATSWVALVTAARRVGQRPG
jgi:hypothetical protein